MTNRKKKKIEMECKREWRRRRKGKRKVGEKNGWEGKEEKKKLKE